MGDDTCNFHAWQACGKSKEGKHAARDIMKSWDIICYILCR